MHLRMQHSSRRAVIGPAVMTVGAAITLVGAFQRWLSSGSIGRSSFQLLGLIQRLGFAPTGAARTAVRSWPFMPLLLTVGIVAVWWGWRTAGVVFATIGAVFAGIVGAVVAAAAPETRSVQVSNAPVVTAVGAAIVVVGSLLVVLVRVPSADGHS